MGESSAFSFLSREGHAFTTKTVLVVKMEMPNLRRISKKRKCSRRNSVKVGVRRKALSSHYNFETENETDKWLFLSRTSNGHEIGSSLHVKS